MTNSEPEILEMSEDRSILRVDLAFCYATKAEELPDFIKRCERDFGLIKKFVAKELDSGLYMKRAVAEEILDILQLVYRDYGRVAVMQGFLEDAPEPQLVSLGRVLKDWCDNNMPGATPRPFVEPAYQPRRKAKSELRKQLTLPEVVEPPVLVMVAPEPKR